MATSRGSVRLAALAGLASLGTASGDVCEPYQFDGPASLVNHSQWLDGLNQWRNTITAQYAPTWEVYQVPQLNWTRTSYIHTQIHIFDRTLFDGKDFTVDAYLDDLERRFGGIDSVLLWATYTNLGIDDRNQFDLYAAIPGSLDALANITAAFHRRGVRVLQGYNPWDNATRSMGEPHWDTMAKFLKATRMDGYNGDTMPQMPKQFWQASVDAGYPIAGEPEGGGFPCQRELGDTWAAAGWTPLGWGYFWNGWNGHQNSYAFEPGVDRLRWLDGHGWHLTHVTDRWSKNRAEAVLLAYFNGNGYNAWENIWGLFNQVTDRDGELIRRVGTILRWAGNQGYITGFDEWVPYAPEATSLETGVFASRFSARGDSLWLVVNKNSSDSTGFPVHVPQELLATHKILDLVAGLEVQVNATGVVRINVEGLSIGAVLATTQPEAASDLMTTMQRITEFPLSHYSADWHYLPQRMVPPPETPAHNETPAGMVLIPSATFHFQVSSTEMEGGCDPSDDPNGVCCQQTCAWGGSDCQCGINGIEYFGIGVQFPWETKPSRNHDKVMQLGPFLMDVNLVTNADYLAYLQASNYQPQDSFNWLRHWQNGAPMPGDELKPVVNIGLEEARAYCSFYGKRLPHSYEWQYAAQGTDGRTYPWGRHFSDKAVPVENTGPAQVGTHPTGDSPFGVHDMVGNVWQYTDAFEDDHTRSVLLRGSSNFHIKVTNDFPSSGQYANWYFPPALELTKQSKYFLMSDSYERAGTLGFRCVADVAGGAPAPYHYTEPASQPVPTFV